MDAATQQRMRKLNDSLQNIPPQYQNRQRLGQDLTQLFRVYSTLQPMTGTFTGGGRSATLFYLYGVLPIQYRGGNYNIPITIYFDPPYPRQAPRCFVTPTDNMAVAPNHPNVNSGGLFNAPVLQGWNEHSSLTELISAMVSSFSHVPPVHSTAGGGQARPQQPQTAESGLIGAVSAVSGWFGGAGGGQPPSQPPGTAGVSPAAHVVAQPVGAGAGKEALIRKTTHGLKERWPIVLGKIVSEINDQLDKRHELKAQAEKLEHDLADLKIKADQQEEQVRTMEATEAELTAFVQATEGKELDPDDLRNQLDPDSRQVLDNLAEELALDDFLVALDELLAAKKINIDDFVRETREVGRKKFMCMQQRKKSDAAIRAASGSHIASV